MTIPRMLVLLIGLSSIGIAVVGIRVEESRVLRRIQAYQSEEIEARQEIRAQEMRLWALRSPTAIRQRAAELQPVTDNVPPSPRGVGGKASTKKR